MTELESSGWGVLLELSALSILLASISTAHERWSAMLNDNQDEPASVSIMFETSRQDVDLTSDGLTFPTFVDALPLLSFEPLVALHPALARHIKKSGLQQMDPMSDFAVIWPPIREALTIESLRGAAKIFGGFSGRRRRADEF